MCGTKIALQHAIIADDVAVDVTDDVRRVMAETLENAQLSAVCGGMQMKITQYGYPNDPYPDSETRAGHGAYRNLDQNSMAITDAGLLALGLSRQDVTHNPRWVRIQMNGGGGALERRIDDRAPESDLRADLYMPRGFDRGIQPNEAVPVYGDVTLR